MREHRGRVAVRDIASQVGWSPRHLGECFRAEYGHPPKTIARVLRFQESHRLVSAGLPLGRVAADCGFTDQSHLIREWHAFVGSAPTRWMQADELAFVQDRDRQTG